MSHPRLALAGWTTRSYFESEVTINHALHEIRKIGYEFLEVSETGVVTYKQFLKHLSEAGLKCSGIYAPCLWTPYKERLSTSEIAESLHEVLDALSEVKGDTPVLHFMGSPDMIPRGDRKNRGIREDVYSRLADSILIAKNLVSTSYRGVRFSYHLYDFDLLSGLNTLMRFHERAGLSFTLDNYFMHLASLSRNQELGMKNVIVTLSGSVNVLHVNDFAINPYSPLSAPHRALGNGNAELVSFIRDVSQHMTGVDYVVLEHEAGVDDGLRLAKTSYEYFFKTLFSLLAIQK